MIDDPHQWLVAHRGHASRFPENTLSAFRSAARAGVTMIEFDLQFTADDVPVVIHDADLRRTAGRAVSVRDLRAADLAHYPAGYADKFDDQFGAERLLSLAELVDWFAGRPELVPIAEIKGESAAQVGVERAVTLTLEQLAPVLERSVVISFVEQVVAAARREGAPRVGWCITTYDSASKHRARELAPDYLLVNYRDLPTPPTPLWPGPWQWMAWEIADPAVAPALASALALELRARGIDFIETMACVELLAALESGTRD